MTAWWPALAVLGACLAWGLDNNLTREVSLSDASHIAMSKGLAAGATNLVLAVLSGAHWPGAGPVLAAGLLGFASYGASLVLFVLGLRQLGTARTGSYFSIAPFAGALLSITLLGEPITAPLLLAALLMGIGVALHLTERHEHEHVHGTDDLHHHHHREHDPPVPTGTRHTHSHRHEPMTHIHGHFPDAHHRHAH